MQIEAVRPHRNANQIRARFEKQIPQTGINGFFDRNTHPRPHQRAAQQVDGLLTAVRHDNVVSGRGKIGAAQQEVSQRLIARGRTHLKQRTHAFTGQNFVAGRPEFIHGKQAFRGPGR